MIITCKKGAPQAEIDKIIKEFEDKGLEVNLIRGVDYNVFGIVGDTTIVDEKSFARIHGLNRLPASRHLIKR